MKICEMSATREVVRDKSSVAPGSTQILSSEKASSHQQYLIFFAFITENNSLEPLFEGRGRKQTNF